MSPATTARSASRRVVIGACGRRLDELISARTALEQVNEAFDRMRKGEAAREVIVFD